MNDLLKFKLDHSNSYVISEQGNNMQRHQYDLLLEDICKNLGFPVSVRDIVDMDETDFASARNNTFGASDSAVLLGVAYSSKYVKQKTPDELVHEKVINFWNTEIGKLASVRKGKELEDFIIQKFEKILNAFILKPAHMYTNNEGLATNFDGVVFEEVVTEDLITGHKAIPFEIKVCTMWANKNYNWDKAISEFAEKIELVIPEDITINKSTSIDKYIEAKANHFGIPKYYYTQLQQQMLFLGSNHGHLGVMKDSDWELFIFTIPRDQHMIEKLLEESLYHYLRLCIKKGLPKPY